MIFDPFYIIAMIGTAVFALSGAMAAARKELDIFGFILVGLAPAVGGGTVRDILLDAEQVFWMIDLNYLYVASLVSIIAFFQVHRLDGKRQKILIWADAVGLALFSVMGAQVAMSYDAHPVIIVIMGMVTGTFGGVVRDIVCNELPLLLTKEIYALPALAGGAVYWASVTYLKGPDELFMVIAMAVVFFVRAQAILFEWSLPQYRPKNKP